MSDIESEIQQLRSAISGILVELAVVKTQVELLRNSVDRQQDLQTQSSQRVPVLLLGAISAAIAAVGVLVSVWMAGGS